MRAWLSLSNTTVALTFDDLPYATAQTHSAGTTEQKEAVLINQAILSALSRHKVPATGFVIEKHVRDLGEPGKQILAKWVQSGQDLGNHSYSHADFNQLSVAEMKQEIISGEATSKGLMFGGRKKLRFFRFPMNHTGDTKDKHDQIASFLVNRGYEVATCTFDNSDYIFNAAYEDLLGKHDRVSAERLRSEYLSYTNAEIDYYAELNRKVLGYELPEVMLLHDNRLNADMIEDLLKLFERKSYGFVTLEEAQADPAYESPDTFISKYGPMWGYRWAVERGIKVNGKLEPEPPDWIVSYGKQ